MQGKLVMLDVSQSVDLDHPHALDFLRADAKNVSAFFRRKGISTLTTRELFEFVVDPSISRSNMQDAIVALLAVAEGRINTPEEDVDDAVREVLSFVLEGVILHLCIDRTMADCCIRPVAVHCLACHPGIMHAFFACTIPALAEPLCQHDIQRLRASTAGLLASLHPAQP